MFLFFCSSRTSLNHFWESQSFLGLPDLDLDLDASRSRFGDLDLERDLSRDSRSAPPFLSLSARSPAERDRERSRFGLGLRLLERERSLGGGDRLRLLDLDRPPLSLPPLERDLDRDRDLERGDRLLDRDPPDLERLPRNFDSSVNLIRRPLSSAPSSLSNAVFISLSEANSTHPSFLLGLWASAYVTSPACLI